MTGNQDQVQQTGTRNETYDVIAVLYHALQGAENCQRYIRDAQDDQTRSFFEQALQAQRQLADQGKQILQQVIQKESGSGGSAFGWSQQGQSGQSPSQNQSLSQDQFTSASPNSTGGGSF